MQGPGIGYPVAMSSSVWGDSVQLWLSVVVVDLAEEDEDDAVTPEEPGIR